MGRVILLRLSVNSLIYFYIFICISLLIFNVFYILHSGRVRREHSNKINFWEKEILSAVEYIKDNECICKSHAKNMLSKLKRIGQLTAYNQAVINLKSSGSMNDFQAYFDLCHDIFQELALHYSKREPMERAYMAYLISDYHPDRNREHDVLNEILLGYMENSTVYCRQNVLCALYSMGSESAVETAFSMLNDNGWYHNPKLISDGLAIFPGNKEELALRLWVHSDNWREELRVAIVQFASQISDVFADKFLDVLKDGKMPLEIRFAVIRYFQKYPCDSVRPILIGLIYNSGEDNGLSIAAAASLAKYPGTDTKTALRAAIHSPNWYVRKNAAASLSALGIDEYDIAELKKSGDRYAAEMLEYMADVKQKEMIGA